LCPCAADFAAPAIIKIYPKLEENQKYNLNKIPQTYQLGLDKLVDDKVDHGLADSEIAGGDALVEGSNASLGVDPLDALSYGHLHLGVVV